MFSSICGWALVGVLRLLLGYLAQTYEFLTPAIPWMNWILIGVSVYVGILLLVYLIKQFRRRED